MPTNKQRRDAARRHLERQLQHRAEREAARKRLTLIASVAGTLVVVAAVIVVIVVATGGDNKKPAAAGNTPAASATPTAAANPCGAAGAKPVPTATGAGAAVSFNGVTVKGATDLSKPPSVGSAGTAAPTTLQVKDLVVGKGAAATPTSSVSVKYTGVLYCDGTEFDGPAEHGDKTVDFSLTGVVPGFTQGIGGTDGIAPMKVGGRRIIIMPAALGYGASPQPGSGIPPNAPLVFVVDLVKTSG
ncbi:FKBP-type peptidyl-prolyl cis-trans isomerase [Jatrophihabitans cynanchi]|uniref:Peptidyl-prolyl cis-trans isomerase n=1 Tax=Jatrophihabitans cynanchi TaxID=2944128 RepID=A0ABY7JX53_9ACTN|nr:FKBP-type peptidyl-prolyl cis-trans isomerase [Jatrophihabitans sp. SB3-54]WAX56883.1 FKBP-type peptidyl-prolyl cis-trans isomerase [Jatrophihabitans sp. SB3-54]